MPVKQTDDIVKLEILLSEAVLFLQSLQNIEEHGLENTSDVINEFVSKITEANSMEKKGIKAQKVNKETMILFRSAHFAPCFLWYFSVEHDISGIASFVFQNGSKQCCVSVEETRSTYTSTSYRFCHQRTTNRSSSKWSNIGGSQC